MYFITRNTPLFNTFKNIELCSLEYCLEYFKDKKYIGLDTETEGFDPYTKGLLLIQLGDNNNQFAIDNTIDIQLLKPLLEDKNKTFLLHNAKFDLRFLYHKRIVISNVYDSYLAEKLLWLGYPPGLKSMSLKSIVFNYLGVELNKEIRGLIHRERYSERVIEYGCNDVKYLLQLREKQLVELKNKELETALSIENNFVKVLAYIEYCGIKLDKNLWKNKMTKDLERFNSSKKQLDDWLINKEKTDKYFSKFITKDLQGDLFTGFNNDYICKVNWDSSTQVIPIFEHLGFDLWTKDKKTKQLKKSVESKIISLQESISDITPLYLNYKGYSKIIGTYGESFLKQINPVSGRIHTQFSQLMDTGRLSCGGKDKDNKIEYVNLQNLPSDNDTRHSFVAEKNNLLIDCDYTAQEDFVFTELSQEPKLIEFYNDKTRKRDGHSFVAKICFPLELDDIKEEDVKHIRPDLRALAKKAKFAIHYGGNGSTIATNLSLPEEQGYQIEKSYLSGFKNINNYFKYVKKDMWDKGYITISKLTGHKMFIWNWKELKEIESQFSQEFWSKYKQLKESNPTCKLVQDVKSYFQNKSGYERNSLNAPVQGTSAIITKIAGIKYFNYLVENNLLFTVLIPNCVHDEYLIESPKNIAKEQSIILSKCMEDSANIFCKSVKLKAVPEISHCWVH